VSVCVQALPSSHTVVSALAGFEHVPFAGLQVPARWHWSCAVHATGFAPVQVPPWQVSACVQALPSLHAVPFGLGTAAHAPVPGLHVPTLHALVSPLQSTDVPLLQVSVPRSHVSAPLQALPSLQSASFWHLQAALSTVQPPAVSLQLSTVHAMPSSQVTALPAHVPFVHASPLVHTSPSLQDVPSAAAGFEQVPVAESQTPAVWHWSCAEHATGFDPAHPPCWQVSTWVQAFPSSQVVPFAFGGLVQKPSSGLQVPAMWHWSCAVHTTGFAPVQSPAWQLSVCVHGLPSSQELPSTRAGFEHAPLFGSQAPATWH
jgi:hypothetical protein